MAQLENIKNFIEIKRKYSKIYKNKLEKYSIIEFQKEYKDAASIHWLTCIGIKDDKMRGKLLINLQKEEIPYRKLFMPLCEMPYLKKYSKKCPVAYDVYKKGICLPGSTLNTEDQITDVAAKIESAINNEG